MKIYISQMFFIFSLLYYCFGYIQTPIKSHVPPQRCFDDGTYWIETDSDTLNFLAIGDWGVVKSTKKIDIDESIIQGLASKMESAKETNFVINIGDSFYQNGVKSVWDSRWESTFENVFNSTRLKSIYWYSVLGNHDYRGSTRSQIEYTRHLRNSIGRWCMPNYYYTFVYRMLNFAVRFIAIDTFPLLHVCEGGCQRVTKSHCLHTNLPEECIMNPHFPKYEEQMKWLEDTLRNTAEEYIVVIGHHFISSIGPHGLPDSLSVSDESWGYSTMRNEVRNLLYRFNVNIYIAGHDHVTQVIIHHRNGMKEIGVGNAGKIDGFLKGGQTQLEKYYGKDVSLKYASLEPAFANIQISATELNVKLVGLTTSNTIKNEILIPIETKQQHIIIISMAVLFIFALIGLFVVYSFTSELGKPPEWIR